MAALKDEKNQNKFDARFSQSTNGMLADMQAHFSGGADILQLMQSLVVFHAEYGSMSYNSSNSRNQSSAPPFQDLIQFLQYQSALRLPKYTNEEWIKKVLAITTHPKTFSDINGRMFLISALLSEYENINKQLKHIPDWQEKCWVLISKLEEELLSQMKIDFIPLLTDYGKEIRNSVIEKIDAKKSEDHESILNTRNIGDSPTKKDDLSRKPLAEYIANRLRFVYNQDIDTDKNGAFFMHIDGAWGSGKSTLLGFLEAELEKKKTPIKNKSGKDWLVVNFNAWENQRLDPPWWFLMNAVFQEISTKVRTKSHFKWLKLCTKELWWRWRMGTGYTIAAILALGISVLLFIYGKDLNSIWIVQIVTFIGGIWATAKSVSSSLPLTYGSSKAAQAFIEANSADPMHKLSEHFRDLINGIENPIAIFIDDLDRCNRDYGVKLLEGLQTIFKKAPVVYVIAADRRWLKTMYGEQYDKFSAAIQTPTKPLGLIFLDKIFQWILELPDISAEQKKIYWGNLLDASAPNKKEAVVKAIKQEVLNTNTMTEKMGLIDKTPDAATKQLYREAIVSTTAIQKEERAIEHKLLAFVNLIEPNPRAMKRLINDIGTAKALSILYNRHVEQEQLILWTILKQQHPILAELLWEEPTKIDNTLLLGKEYEDLFKKKEVRQLFEYTLSDKTVKLDLAFLQKMKFQYEESNHLK